MPISDFLQKLASLLKEAKEKDAAKVGCEELSSRMDSVTTREEFDKIVESEAYKAFTSEVQRRVNDLHALFDAYVEKYDCSIVIGVVTINSPVADGSGIAGVGRSRSLVVNCKALLSESVLQTPMAVAKVLASK
ncbi:MAG: hypothetical protein HDR44_01160 [Allobaculum sp.]|nr:hypothetical protein [Allobaculum sp.]